MARAGNGETDAAIRVFDLVFADGLPTTGEGNLVLLIKVWSYSFCRFLDQRLVALRLSSCLNAENMMKLFCGSKT
jgi:hypothetical protein